MTFARGIGWMILTLILWMFSRPIDTSEVIWMPNARQWCFGLMAIFAMFMAAAWCLR